MNDIKVGQVLYVREKGGIGERTVTRVARKYFYIEKHGRELPISLEDLYHRDSNYTKANFQMYVSLEDLENEDKAIELSRSIRHIIGQYGSINLPLPVLEQIYDLLTKQ